MLQGWGDDVISDDQESSGGGTGSHVPKSVDFNSLARLPCSTEVCSVESYIRPYCEWSSRMRFSQSIGLSFRNNSDML